MKPFLTSSLVTIALFTSVLILTHACNLLPAPAQTQKFIGKPYKIENLQFTIQSITQTPEQVQTIGLEQGEEWLILRLKFTNLGQEKQIFSDWGFELQDKGNNFWRPFILFEGKGFPDRYFAKGQSAEADIAFKIPKGKKGLNLRYPTYLLEEQQLTIPIN